MNRLLAWLVPIKPIRLRETPYWLLPVRHHNCRCTLPPL